MRKSLVGLSFLVFALDACKESSTDPAAGPPTTLLVLAGGAPQSGTFGQPVPVAPTVLVTDAKNRPVPGVSVVFAAAKGGGTVNAASQTTGANGNASVVWTLGNTFGDNVLSATVSGLGPVVFTATALAPPAGIVAFTMIDPANDTLTLGVTSGPKAIDLLSVRGDYKSDSLIVTATFGGPVVLAAEVANGLGGYIDIDIDDNTASGLPYTNDFGGSASLGIEYELDFFGDSPNTMILYSLTKAVPVAAAVVGNTVVARVPMALIGSDDGNFSLAGVFGTRERATDIFPNAGQGAVRRSIGVSSILTTSRASSRPQSTRGPLSAAWKQRTAIR